MHMNTYSMYVDGIPPGTLTKMVLVLRMVHRLPSYHLILFSFLMLRNTH